ncbi:MAG TPA: hypothetical protein DHW65_05560 [Dehalococcoidia bacterium]|nr:hypothetical protein [Chloroflexota bacterium]HCL25796.1 hypothetical protein [Dehalococcoidia bacterium]
MAGLLRKRPKLSPQAEREVRRDTPLRRARTCYGHLAGVAGVELMDRLLALGWLKETLTPASGNRVAYRLSQAGIAGMEGLNVDLGAAARTTGNFAFGCLDWTEGRQHLGGALGRAVTASLAEQGLVGRTEGTREVKLEGSPRAWLPGNA